MIPQNRTQGQLPAGTASADTTDNFDQSTVARAAGGDGVNRERLAFSLVNITYIALCWELIDRRGVYLPPTVRRAMHLRSVVTLAMFTIAAVVSLVNPAVGLALIVCCLILYVRPDVPRLKPEHD